MWCECQEVTRQPSGQTEMSQMEVFSSETRPAEGPACVAGGGCHPSLFARKRCHKNPWQPMKIIENPWFAGRKCMFFWCQTTFFGLETCFFVQETMWASMFFIGRKTIVCFEEEMWNDGLKRTGGFVMGFF